MTDVIGLTGVTGHLGGKVLRRVVDHGDSAVLLARTPRAERNDEGVTDAR